MSTLPGIDELLLRTPVVPFDAGKDRLYPLDLTAANTVLNPALVNDTAAFDSWVTNQIRDAGARYAIGGYNEHRTVYSRSALFDPAGADEPRRLHLGTDIWGEAGTPVFAPLAGRVHSFANNAASGDYGATIILEHDLDDGSVLHTLYGHLDLASLRQLQNGASIEAGERIARFGAPAENGNWPPHLHFQLILDMQGRVGDYPGVCRYSERENWLANSPDPDQLLQLNQYQLPKQ